jgi:hypothetical protein
VLAKSFLSLGFLGAAALALAPLPADADENMFGYSYGVDTLPRGAFELYSWLTWRHSKEEGHYDAFDLQLELEYGITDRFQTSTYLTFDGRNQGNLDEFDDVSHFRWNGVKQAFKYNLLSTYKDPIGLSLYVEPGYSRYDKVGGERVDELELETKLILQKNFLDDTLAWALNVSPEFEWEFPNGESSESEFVLEVTTGLSYRFAPNWYAGLELRYHTEFPEYEFQEHQAVFLGPNLHYGGKRWWATLTVLPQIWGEPNEGGSHRHFEEHEAVEVRLKVGYNF